jgi:hypothetical protein
MNLTTAEIATRGGFAMARELEREKRRLAGGAYEG